MGVDNPETTETLVTIFSMGIGIFFFVCFVGGILGNAEPLDFSGDIGEVDDQDMFAMASGDEGYLAAHSTFTPIKTKKKKKVKKAKAPKKPMRAKRKRPKVKVGPDKELLTDCIDALAGLGVKRGQARITATKILTADPSLTTVELFLRKAFKHASP
jgi:hypothetical protein